MQNKVSTDKRPSYLNLYMYLHTYSYIFILDYAMKFYFAVFFLVLLGCSSQWGDISVPNGYRIECDKSRSCIVLGNNREVVLGPEVNEYLIVSNYLIGHVIKEEPLPGGGGPKPILTGKLGYFILNTQNNKMIVGLGKDEWRKRLLKLGIRNPQLRSTAYRPRATSAT